MKHPLCCSFLPLATFFSSTKYLSVDILCVYFLAHILFSPSCHPTCQISWLLLCPTFVDTYMAFKMVDLSLLFHTLYSLSFHHITLSCFSSNVLISLSWLYRLLFLSCFLNSGISQDFVLDPLLFLSYILFVGNLIHSHGFIMTIMLATSKSVFLDEIFHLV